MSGKNKIPMAELRTHLAKAGYKNAKTYIQSGNIFFPDSKLSRSELETKTTALIKKHWDYEVPTIVRTQEEIHYMIDNNPFLQKEDHNLKGIYFTMLDRVPNAELIDALHAFNTNDDQWVLDGANIYIYYPNGAGKAKLTNNLIERKLKVTATSRNLNTMKKMLTF